MRMFDPEWIVGNRLDLAGRLQYPAFAPGVDDAVLGRLVGQESHRQFENDCIAVLARPRVLARIHETEISIGGLLEAIAGPGKWSRRHFSLHQLSPYVRARD